MWQALLSEPAWIALAAFLAIFILVLLTAQNLLKNDRHVTLRVEEILADEQASPTRLNLPDVAEAGLSQDKQLFRGGQENYSKFSFKERGNYFLEKGGLKSRKVKMIAIVAILISSLILSAATCTMLLWLEQSATVVAAGTVAGLFVLPLAFAQILEKRYLRHQQRMVNSLSDFMDLIVICLESGMSLDGSLRRVTQELEVAHPLLAVEMSQVQREVELGTTLENAFYHLAQRTGIELVSTMACFIEQSRRYGTSVADALREHSDMIREKRETRAETLAQKASMKILLPTLLLIFPATFVVLAGPAVMEVTEAFEEAENPQPQPGIRKGSQE